MKRIKVFYIPSEFEEFINHPTVEVLTLSIQACESNATAQYGFIAVVFYKEVSPVKPESERNSIIQEAIDSFNVEIETMRKHRIRPEMTTIRYRDVLEKLESLKITP